MSLAKEKLPKGLSYPLKRSVLDAAFAAAALTGVTSVSYVKGSGRTRTVLDAYHVGDGRRGAAMRGQQAVRVWAVPSANRKAAEDVLIRDGLPRLLAWLRELERAGNTRRGADQWFAAAFGGATLTVEAT